MKTIRIAIEAKLDRDNFVAILASCSIHVWIEKKEDQLGLDDTFWVCFELPENNIK